jgi:CubicO group peptidase (beta-lactamase class C family)
MKLIYLLLFVIIFHSCTKDDGKIDVPIGETKLYFPPIDSDEWDTTTIDSLNWNLSATNDLFDFLSQKGTRGFILLSEGKIVIEKYWGNDILNIAPFDKNSNWYWASAGKTLTAFLVGLSQEKGLIDIDNKSSDYLGNNWSSLSSEKEDLILVRHHLTMTSGLDYRVSNPDCTSPDCLQYKADAGTQWFYHNAPYTLLETIVSNASGQTYNEFTDLNIESKIGMDGRWIYQRDNNVYWSTARDAARFGLLMLNKGKWSDHQIMADQDYYNAMTTSSQSLNPSYGYCTWLNGKSSIVLPGLPISFKIPLSENAPSDLFAAMGKNGQFIDVVPSKNIVVIRMGEALDNSLVPRAFHDEMWAKINSIIN